MRTWVVVVAVGLVAASCTEKAKEDAGTPVPAPPPLPPVAVQVEPPPPVLTVHAVIGDGSQRVIFRGSVASVRTGAVALGIDGGIPLPEAGLKLTVTGSDGGVQPWVFDRLTPPRPNHVLTGNDFDANITWSMEAAKTAQLPLGKYTLRFEWAGETTQLDFEVRDPPPQPSADWQETDVEDRIGDLLDRRQLPEARALMNQALATWPTSYSLLNLNALLFEAEGDKKAAFESAAKAERIWSDENPGKKKGYGHGHIYNRLFGEYLYEGLVK